MEISFNTSDRDLLKVKLKLRVTCETEEVLAEKLRFLVWPFFGISTPGFVQVCLVI